MFISQPLLKQHNEKYYNEGKKNNNWNEESNKTPQLPCALYEDHICQFQCESLGELNNHIEKKKKNMKMAPPPPVQNPSTSGPRQQSTTLAPGVTGREASSESGEEVLEQS